MANQNTPDYEARKKSLYGDLKSYYKNIEPYEKFAPKLDDAEKRRRIFDNVSKKFDMGDYAEFEKYMGYTSSDVAPIQQEQQAQQTQSPTPAVQAQQNIGTNNTVQQSTPTGNAGGATPQVPVGNSGTTGNGNTANNGVVNIEPIKADSAGVAAPVVNNQPKDDLQRGLNSPLQTFENGEQAQSWAEQGFGSFVNKESMDERIASYQAPRSFNDVVTEINNEYTAENDSLNRQVEELNAASDSLNAKYPEGWQPKTEKELAQYNKDVKQYNDSVAQFKANANAFDEKLKNDKRMQQVNPLSARYAENGGWTYEQEQKLLELQQDAHDEHKETKANGAKTKAYEDAAMEATGIYDPKAAVKAFEDYNAAQSAKEYEKAGKLMLQQMSESAKNAKEAERPVPSVFATGTASNGLGVAITNYQQTERGKFYTAENIVSGALQHIENYKTYNSQRGQGWAGNTASGIANTGRGFYNTITDLSTWDFGITDLSQSTMLLAACKKFNNEEELTEGERAILDASAYQMAVQGALNTGLGFQAGEVTGYAIPFMIQMMVSPEAQVGNSVGATVARWAMKGLFKKGAETTAGKLGRIALKRVIKYGTQIIANDIRGNAMALNPMQIATTAAGIQSRKINNIDGAIGEDGVFHADKVDFSDDSWTETLWKGIMNQGIENSSEFGGDTWIGDITDFLWDFSSRKLRNTRLGRAAHNFTKRLNTSDVGRFFGRMKDSDYYKVVSELRKRSHISGIRGEVDEEIYGGIAKAALGIEGQMLSGYDNNGNWQNGVFSIDNYSETFMTMLPMQVMFGMMGMGGYGVQSAVANREKKGAIGQMKAAFYDGHQPFIDMIDSFNEKTFGEELKTLLSDPSLSMEQKTALLRYATATQFWRGTDAAIKADQAHDIHEKVFGEAYQKGYDMTDPDEQKIAYALFQDDLYYLGNFKEFSPVAERKKREYEKMLAAGDYSSLFEAMTEDGCTEMDRKVMERYITSRQIVAGINAALEDKRQEEISAAAADVSKITDNDGNVVEATLFSGEHGYVMSNDGENAYILKDGEETPEPVKVSQLFNISQPVPASAVFEEKIAPIEEKYNSLAQEIDGDVESVSVGEDLSKYGLPATVSAVNGDNFSVVFGDGTTKSFSIDDLKSIIRGSRLNSELYQSITEARKLEDEVLMPNWNGETLERNPNGNGAMAAQAEQQQQPENAFVPNNTNYVPGMDNGGEGSTGTGGAGAAQMSAEMRALLDGYPVLYNNGTDNVWMHLGNGQKEEDGKYLVEFFKDEELSDSTGGFLATMQQIEGMLHPNGVETPEQKAEREKAEKEAEEAARKAEEEARKKAEEEEAARKEAEEEAAKKAAEEEAKRKAEEEEKARKAEEERAKKEKEVNDLLDYGESHPEMAWDAIERIDNIVSNGYTLTSLQDIRRKAIVKNADIETDDNGGEGGDGGRKPAGDAPENPSEDKPDGENPKPVHKDPNFGKSNTFFTEQKKNDALERIRKRRQSRLNSGLDPQDLADFITVAGYCFEGGARKIADFARAMIVECTNEVSPYIKQIYMAAKHDPVIKENLGIDRKEFSSEDEVDDFDVDSIDVKEQPSEQPADGADEEEEREEKYAEGYDKLPADKNGIRSGDTFEDKNGHYRTLVCYIGGKATVWVYDKDGKPIANYVSKRGEVSKSVKDGKWTRINPNTNDATWEIHVKAVENSLDYFDEESDELSEEDKRRIAWAKKSLKEKIAEIERRGILDSSSPVTAKEAALWLIAKGFTLTTDAFERDFPQLISSKARDNAKYMRWKDDKNGAKSLQAIAEGAWSDYPEYIQTKYDDHDIYLELSGMELDSSAAVDELDRMTRQEDERDTEEYRQMVENHGFTDDEMEEMFEILNEISINDEGNLSQDEINSIFADAYDEEINLIDSENNMWADAAYEREQQEKDKNDGESKGVQGLAGQSGLQGGSEGVDKVGGTEGVSKEGGNTQSDGSRKDADTKGNDGPLPAGQVFGGVSKEELDSEEAKRIHDKWEDKRKNLEEQKKNVLAEKNKKRREIVGRSELANSLFGDISDTSGNLFDNNETPEDYSDNTIKDAMRPFDEKIADIDKQIEDSYRLEKEEIAALGTQTVIREDAKEEDKKKEEKPEKKELTVEDIDNIPDEALSPTLKTLAKAYITGDASARANAFNQLAYIKAEQYVRNQSGNVPANSGDASGSNPVAQEDNGNGGRGDGGRSGIEGQPVDNEPVQQPTGSKGSEGSVPTAAGKGGDSHVAPEKPSDGTARGGQRRAGGTDRNEGGHVSRPANTGGSSAASSSDGVGSNPAKPVDHKQAGKDKFKAALDKFKKAGKDSNNRANLDLIKLVSLGTISVDQLEPMMEMAGALVEMGYGYVESGIRNFARFIDQFREDGVCGMLKDDVQLTDEQVESFIQDAWNSPFEMNGDTMTIAQWAQKMSDEALRESIKTSLEDKLRLQREAENVEAKIYDLDNIRATLPYLLPAQQEDVWKAEMQFFNPTHADREHAGGKGIMFTNGTGTGKTYTGLGIVKRFIKQGKGRILIITPSAEKVGDWIEDAKNLGIDLRSLDEPDEVDTDENGKKKTPTTRKGKGAVITTFANFRANQALLEDDFDLVMYDESHKIMESKNATKTSTTRQHFLMTNKDYESAMERLKAIHPLWIRENDINGRIKEIGETETNLQKILRADDIYPGWRRSWNIEFLESEKSSASSKETRDAINSYLSLLKEKGELEKELEEIKKLQPAELAKMTPRANEAVKKTKVVFLSATPFNTRDNLDYAEGYIFSYPEEDPNTKGSRNHRSGRDLFYEKHFGSSVTWKYGKQQKRSDSNEDLVSQQEMAFAEYLMSLGTLSTRQIDNGYDYSRDFPIMNVVEAAAFNDALEDMMRSPEMRPLQQLSPFWDYQAMSVLFETMKVAAVLPRIRQHIALGRKIVIFHRRVNDSKNLAQPPFALTLKHAKTKVALLRMDHNAKSQSEADKIEKAIDAFMEKYSRLLDWEKKLDYRMPRQQLAAAFGDTKEYTPEEAMAINEAQENAGGILTTKKNTKAAAELGVRIANVVETEFEAYDILDDYKPTLDPQEDGESDKDFAARKKAHSELLKAFNENKKAAKEAIKKRFEERIAAGEVKAPKLDKNGRIAKKVGYFAGQDSKTEKHADVEAFNDDDSEMKVIVIQEASGKEGISLHDKTGNHQRVIMQLALPQSPIAFIQIEGRVYRIGQASNAIFEYPLLGINQERTLFATRINGAASTTENLAMGEQARALKQSIMKGVLEHSGNIPVEGQGVGGKEFDTRTANKETGFDVAIKDYYGNQKMQSGRKNHENDYYPTPEPLGFKLIEWLDLQEAEGVLEPSAGHGAIARYVPQDNPMLAVEIGNKQFGDLAIITGAAERGTDAARGKSHLIMNSDFMELAENGNKFDCIVMNPPYGVGGKEAMAHIEKAWKHLRNGGRLIAIVPDGPAMEKRLEGWLNGERELTEQEKSEIIFSGEDAGGKKAQKANGAHVVAEVHLPSVTFGRAGTSIKTKVIIIDKQEDKKVGRRIDMQGKREVVIDEKAKIDDLFEELRDMSMPKRIIDPAAKAEKAVEKFISEVSHNEALSQTGQGEKKKSDVYIYNRNGEIRSLAMVYGKKAGSIWKLLEIVYMRGSRNTSYADLPLATIAKPTQQLAEMYVKAKNALNLSTDDFWSTYWTDKEYVQDAKDLISAWMKMIRKGSGLTENQLERLSRGEDVYVPVELKPGIPITMQKIRELFDGANTDERKQVIFDKVWNIANALGLKLRYEEMGASTPAAYQGNGVLKINPRAWSRTDITYEDKADTLLHELLHAVTQYAIEKFEHGQYLPENLRKAVEKMNEAYKQAQKGGIFINALKGDDRYFLSNLHEFVAEVGSNSNVRKALEKTNIWKMIKDGIKKLLGFKDVTEELAKTVGAEKTTILKEAEEALDEMLDSFDSSVWGDYTAEQEIAFQMNGKVNTSYSKKQQQEEGKSEEKLNNEPNKPLFEDLLVSLRGKKQLNNEDYEKIIEHASRAASTGAIYRKNIGRRGLYTTTQSIAEIIARRDDGKSKKSILEELEELAIAAKKSGLMIDHKKATEGMNLIWPDEDQFAENTVYLSEEGSYVRKIWNVSETHKSLKEAMDRVAITNAFFPDAAMHISGITEVDGDVRLIVDQRFGGHKTAKEVYGDDWRNKVNEFLFEKYGLVQDEDNENSYRNTLVTLTDVHDGNVVVDEATGKMHIIDTYIDVNAGVDLSAYAEPNSTSPGIHWGDLGSAEHYGMMMGGGRGTGHFGTGTYFLGKFPSENGYMLSGSRPAHSVDFGKYNLWRPNDFEDGYFIHEFLRKINKFYEFNPEVKITREMVEDVLSSLITKKAEWRENGFDDLTDEQISEIISISSEVLPEDAISELKKEHENKDSKDFDKSDADFNLFWDSISLVRRLLDNTKFVDKKELDEYLSRTAELLGTDKDKLLRIINEVYSEYDGLPTYSKDTWAKVSMSTALMKKLGYEGVDVRGIEGLDNTTYGSVIYDISKDTIRFKKRKKLLDMGSPEYERFYRIAGNLSKEIGRAVSDTAGLFGGYNVKGQMVSGVNIYHTDEILEGLVDPLTEDGVVRGKDWYKAQNVFLLPALDKFINDSTKLSSELEDSELKDIIDDLVEKAKYAKRFYTQMARGNDVLKKGWKRPAFRRSDGRFSVSTGRPEIDKAIDDVAKSLNADVRVVNNYDSLPPYVKRAFESGAAVGYYDVNTGSVVLNGPFIKDADDAVRTVLHEVLGHKGLRAVFGQAKYDKKMHELFNALPAGERMEVVRKAMALKAENKTKGSYRAYIAEAMDEYLAEAAENGAPETISWFDKAVAAFKDILRSLGINVKLTPDDIAYMLWKSGNALKKGKTPWDKALRDVKIQKKYGTGLFDQNRNNDDDPNDPSPNGGGPRGRFRKRSDAADKSVAGQFYAEWNKGVMAAIDEAWHDMLRSLNGLQKAVTKQSGKKLEDFQNSYLMAMHLSSKNKAERDMLLRKYVEPMFEFVGEFIKRHNTSKDEMEKYLIAKHGKERNEAFARRDADRAMEAQGIEQTDPNYMAEWQKAYDEYRKKDYAGLTETFREPGDKKKGAPILILEERAERYVNLYEGEIGTEDIDTLWSHIHGISEFTLKKSYESGMMSRTTYDRVKSQFEWYVPLRGWEETTAGEVYDYLDDNIQREALQQTLKNAYGRKSRAGDILETMCAMAHSASAVGNKNMVKQALLRLAESHETPLITVTKMWYIKNGSTWDVAELPLDATDTIFDGKPYKDMAYEDMTTEDKADFISTWEEDMRSMAAAGNARESGKGLRISTPITDDQIRQHQVRVRRNGKEYIININGSPKAAQAITGKLNADNNPNWLDRLTGYGKRMISRMYTSMNPEFLFRNIQRDFISAVNVSGAKYGSDYAVKLMNNFRRVLPVFGSTTSGKYGGYSSMQGAMDTILGIGGLYTKLRNDTLNESNEIERLFKEFIENGGETGYSQLWTVDDYEKRMKAAVKRATRSTGGKIVHAPFAGLHAIATGISSMNEVFENATRFAVYMTSRQMGKSILQSVNDAKEASTNFNKKGSGALGNRLFRNLFVFANASIQGTMRYIEMLAGRDHYTNDTAIKKNLRKRALASLSVTIGLGAMTTVLNYMIAAAFIGSGDDDDEKEGIEKDLLNPYWRIGDYKRRNNLLIYTGSKSSMLTISLSVEEAAAFGIGSIIAERALGHNVNHSITSEIVSQMSRISPFGSFDPEKFSRSDLAGKSSELASHFVGSYPKIYLDAFLTNRDFMGNDIAYRTTYNEDKPEYTRVRRGTPEYQIRWSERLYDQYGIDVNPNIADYIIKNNFGGLYSFPKKVFEFMSNSIDAINGDYTYSSEEIPISSVFRTQIDAEWQQDRALRAEFDWYKYDIDRINSAIKAMNDKGKSEAAKERLKKRIENDEAYFYWKVWNSKYDIENSFEKVYNSAMKKKDWAKVDKIRMRFLKKIELMEAEEKNND